MNTQIQEVLDAALGLCEEDRFELAEAIAASLQSSGQPPFDQAWRTVVQRRSQELREGKVQGRSWAEVKRHSQEMAGG